MPGSNQEKGDILKSGPHLLFPDKKDQGPRSIYRFRVVPNIRESINLRKLICFYGPFTGYFNFFTIGKSVTINVPVMLKVREVIFYAGKTHNRPFRGILAKPSKSCWCP
jgi:hypothetical protein